MSTVFRKKLSFIIVLDRALCSIELIENPVEAPSRMHRSWNNQFGTLRCWTRSDGPELLLRDHLRDRNRTWWVLSARCWAFSRWCSCFAEPPGQRPWASWEVSATGKAEENKPSWHGHSETCLFFCACRVHHFDQKDDACVSVFNKYVYFQA